MTRPLPRSPEVRGRGSLQWAHAPRLEDIGAAAGISGPGIYRHFAGKAAVLVEILSGASLFLLDGAEAVAARGPSAAEAVHDLIASHTDFALANRDVIRVQGRDMSSPPPADRAEITRVQRRYIDLWGAQLRRLHPGEDHATARFRTQALPGLINSTPFPVRRSRADRGARRNALIGMAWAAARGDGSPEASGGTVNGTAGPPPAGRQHREVQRRAPA
ncbi:TetR/AcrR family transcriptional regulator [Micrococcus porci]|uniref:TetR/AcrR family transcriptional regulator n=1 Tax=Micrococcus porci TaxID=2856555 RepID=UPI003CEBF879